jgi:hypothetical protein
MRCDGVAAGGHAWDAVMLTAQAIRITKGEWEMLR